MIPMFQKTGLSRFRRDSSEKHRLASSFITTCHNITSALGRDVGDKMDEQSCSASSGHHTRTASDGKDGDKDSWRSFLDSFATQESTPHTGLAVFIYSSLLMLTRLTRHVEPATTICVHTQVTFMLHKKDEPLKVGSQGIRQVGAGF